MDSNAGSGANALRQQKLDRQVCAHTCTTCSCIVYAMCIVTEEFSCRIFDIIMYVCMHSTGIQLDRFSCSIPRVPAWNVVVSYASCSTHVHTPKLFSQVFQQYCRSCDMASGHVVVMHVLSLVLYILRHCL